MAAPRRAIQSPTSVEIGYQVGGWWHNEIGDFDPDDFPELRHPTSVRTYRRMSRDTQIAAAIDAVRLPILAANWYIEPNGSPNKVVTAVADELGLRVRDGGSQKSALRQRDRFNFQRHLWELTKKFIYGTAFFEQVYRVEASAKGPSRAHIHKLAWRPPWTISKINVDRDGGLVSIEQHHDGKSGRAPIIPVANLVAYPNDREGGDWYGESLLRRMYPAYKRREELLRILILADQRNGMGIPDYEASPVPEDLLEDAAKEYLDAELQEALEFVKKVGAGKDVGFARPQGSKFRFVGTE
jgi:hypothetical protein